MIGENLSEVWQRFWIGLVLMILGVTIVDLIIYFFIL